MNTIVKANIVLLLTALSITGCSSTPPEPERDPYNTADSQRTRADKTQDELSSDATKNK